MEWMVKVDRALSGSQPVGIQVWLPRAFEVGFAESTLESSCGSRIGQLNVHLLLLERGTASELSTHDQCLCSS